jgi:2-polyprenyl-3-methyl-5-hydroxy-6-metoxy-1,4-benzoquinol methylase
VSAIASELQRQDFQESYGDRPHIAHAARLRKNLWPILLDKIEKALGRDRAESSSKGRGLHILDVGCGYGDFLLEAAERGWSVEGIEINPTMRAKCQDAGLAVSGTPISDRPEARTRADVVTYWNVLDSIENPIKELEAAKAVMRSRGWIWLRVPNGALHSALLRTVSRSRFLEREFIHRDLSPLNAWLMTPKGLTNLFERSGFVEIGLMPAEMSHRGWLLRTWEFLTKTAARLSGGRYLLSSSITVSARLPEAASCETSLRACAKS